MTAPIVNRPRGLINTQQQYIPDSFGDESFRAAYTGANLLEYKAFARPGADEGALVWQIAKLVYDGSNNLIQILWPINSLGATSNDYEFSWTLHATYTYR